MTQLTYEGLIDELFGIRNSSVHLPASKFASAAEEGEEASEEVQATSGDGRTMRQIPLTAGEEMYAEIRDRNFNAVGPALSRKAKLVSAQMEERHDAKTVQDLKKFVDRIPHMTVGGSTT